MKLIIVSLLPLLLGLNAHAGEVELIDDLDIAELADTICNKPADYSRQIYRIATIERLNDYLSGLPLDHQLSTCWTKYGHALVLLNKVVTISNEDACDESKISSIVEFHNKFVTKVHRDNLYGQASDRLQAPETILLFFTHYASEMARICRQSAQLNMRSLSAQDLEQSSLTPDFYDALHQFSKSLNPGDELLGNRRELFLPWNVFDIITSNTDLADTKFALRYVRSVSSLTAGNSYRISIAMKDGSRLRSMQSVCNRFHPVYSRTVLPVIKLTDLGYSVPMETKVPQRWYEITQLCETILSIRVYDDVSLRPNDIVLLTKEEANSARDVGHAKRTDQETAPLARNSIIRMKSLFAVAVTSRQQLDDIKTNIENRARVVGQALGKLTSSLLKSELPSKRDILYFKDDSSLFEDFSSTVEVTLSMTEDPKYVESRREKSSGYMRKVWESMDVTNSLLLLSPISYVGILLLSLSI